MPTLLFTGVYLPSSGASTRWDFCSMDDRSEDASNRQRTLFHKTEDDFLVDIESASLLMYFGAAAESSFSPSIRNLGCPAFCSALFHSSIEVLHAYYFSEWYSLWAVTFEFSFLTVDLDSIISYGIATLRESGF
jgi:hypothetical protein